MQAIVNTTAKNLTTKSLKKFFSFVFKKYRNNNITSMARRTKLRRPNISE